MARALYKKLRWFDQGAAALETHLPGLIAKQLGRSVPPVYICPICLTVFLRSAVAAKLLTAEHVPPESLGGRELVLTCKKCNSDAGAFLDAHAKRKESITQSIRGQLNAEHIVRVRVGTSTVNAKLRTRGKEMAVTVPKENNSPTAERQFRDALTPQSTINVEYIGDRFSELGAKISWFRSGYLALFSVCGFRMVLDPAYRIVRRQILDYKTPIINRFTIKAPGASTDARRLLLIKGLADCDCWGVQFGRTVLVYPNQRDMSFYERLARYPQSKPIYFHGQSYEWPRHPTFGV